MAPRFLTILTGRNLPKIRQLEPSTIIADFTRVVEETGILEREPAGVQRTNEGSPVRWRLTG